MINFRGRLQFISRVNNSIWVCEVLPIKCESDVQSLSIFCNYCKIWIYKICIHISLTLFPTLQVNFRIYVFQYSYCVEYIWKYYNNFEVSLLTLNNFSCFRQFLTILSSSGFYSNSKLQTTRFNQQTTYTQYVFQHVFEQTHVINGKK